MNQERRRRSTSAIGCGFLVFAVLLLFVIGGLALLFSPDDGNILEDTFAKNKIALVRIEGVIMDGRKVIKQIKESAENDSIQAIVVRIVSPGGVVGPSQEIHDEIIKAKKKKPVVASFGSMSASGGYYVGVACDKIVANPGTITGSIGVIMAFNTTYELMEKIGVGTVVIKSGKFKDSGSPHRTLTEEERKLFQDFINSVHDQFTNAVAKGRKMDIEKVRKLSDGRIYTGAQAKENGLVDQLGTLSDAVDLAAKLAGIDGKPHVIETKKHDSFFEALFDDEFDVRIPGIHTRPAGAYYIWAPAL